MAPSTEPWLYQRSPALWHAVRPAAWVGRRMTATRRAVPDLLLIGAPRCGTTSLFWALSHHSGFARPWRKEPHYFDDHFDRGPRWYRAHFPLRSTARRRHQLVYEATPSLLNHPDAPARVKALCPDARFVVLLRDPVERAHSEWALFRTLGWEDEDFATAVAPGLSRESEAAGPGPGPVGYLEVGRYAEHLDQWVELFGRDRMLVMTFDELVSDDAALGRVLHFAGLSDPGLAMPDLNARPRTELDDGLRRRLDDYFAPSLADLRDRYQIDLTAGR